MAENSPNFAVSGLRLAGGRGEQEQDGKRGRGRGRRERSRERQELVEKIVTDDGQGEEIP